MGREKSTYYLAPLMHSRDTYSNPWAGIAEWPTYAQQGFFAEGWDYKTQWRIKIAGRVYSTYYDSQDMFRVTDSSYQQDALSKLGAHTPHRVFEILFATLVLAGDIEHVKLLRHFHEMHK